jgi:hypothetical protein
VADERREDFEAATELLVEVLDELGDEGIGIGERGNSAQAQLLDEPILERLVHALHATFCLWGVRADDVDVELGERSAELGDTVAVGSAVGLGHAERGVLVAEEGDGLSIPLEVRRRRGEIRERRLGLHKTQLHDSAGGVVHVSQPSICTSSPRHSRRCLGW